MAGGKRCTGDGSSELHNRLGRNLETLAVYKAIEDDVRKLVERNMMAENLLRAVRRSNPEEFVLAIEDFLKGGY